MTPDHPHWHSEVLPPLVVETPDEFDWRFEADVVVVGFGGAGASAALRSAEQGLNVIALDGAEGGGATRASGGVFYAGGGTSVQRSVGEEDTPGNMFDYLKLETQGVVSDDTLRRFCETSADMLNWLMGHGVKFSGPVYKEKTSYPNVDYFLYHSDNSLLPPYAAEAKPAARGHRGVIRKGRSAVNLGGSIYDPLKAACLAHGVELMTKTVVRQLVKDRDGRVLGVRALQIPPDTEVFQEHGDCVRQANRLMAMVPPVIPGAGLVHRKAKKLLARAAEIEASERCWVTIRARHGVCLAAGGFIFNRPMVDYHCPAFADGMPLGTPGDDGSGIRLGQSVGGATDRMERATAWRFINPPYAWSKGAMVDASGRRFVNESTYGATIGDAMVAEANGKAWLLLDDALVRDAQRQSRPSKVLPFQWQLAWLNHLFGKKKYRSVEALCEGCGFDQEVVRETLRTVERVAVGDCEDPFGKAANDSQALTFPIHVIDVSLGARLLPCTVLTMGGLVVDEATGEVCREDRLPVPGLYAAGRTAVGLPSHLYMSGLSIADGVFSGLRAADHMVSGAPGSPGK